MYISTEQLQLGFSKQILTQLSNDDPRASEPDLTVVEFAVKLACERIDTALRSRYVLPLAYVPSSLFLYAECLARYWLYGRRPETKMPDTVKENFKWAVAELEKIQTGKLHLGIAETAERSPAESVAEKSATEKSAVENQGDLLPDHNEYEVRSPSRIDTTGY